MKIHNSLDPLWKSQKITLFRLCINCLIRLCIHGMIVFFQNLRRLVVIFGLRHRLLDVLLSCWRMDRKIFLRMMLLEFEILQRSRFFGDARTFTRLERAFAGLNFGHRRFWRFNRNLKVALKNG